MQQVDILAVSTHPDDVELACGGTLILALQQGLAVAIADLTAGEAATRGTPDIRRAEAAEAARRLGVGQRICLGLPDTRVGTDPGHEDAVVEVIRTLRPRILLAPWPEDRHPDHAAGGRLVERAAFLARIAGRGTGTPHPVGRLLRYPGHHPFMPSVVVDVTAVWPRRMHALAAHASQFDPASGAATALADGSFLRFVEARAICHGAMIGAAYGEGFALAGPARVERLDSLLPSGAYGNFA
ncbi:MAG: bacillithiol biosynthesis deacetylase BshB1 [Alphaproteobacteria bacterium]